MCVLTVTFSLPLLVSHGRQELLCHVFCFSVIYSAYLSKHLSVSLSDCLCTRVLIVCVLVQCMEVHHAELQEERVSAGHSPQSA